MTYTYNNKGTCSVRTVVELNDDHTIKSVQVLGGCDGNLNAIPALVEGLTVAEVEQKISGIHCGFKNTSCGDQLAKACRAAYEASQS